MTFCNRSWLSEEFPLKLSLMVKSNRLWGEQYVNALALQQGIPTEKAKEIVKFIKDMKLKVQASINGDFVRVAGRDRDTLQEVMRHLREADFGIDMQFTNYRSN